VPERTLTQRELNRALLARQHLLERTRAPLARVVERIGGIQNQYAPSAYVRLLASVDGFERRHLDRALERRTLIQGTLLRETIHVVSRRDYALFAAGIRRSGQAWWRRVNKVPPDLDMRPLAARAREFLRGTTRSRVEIEEFLRANDFPRTSLWGFSHWIDLVRVPPSGTWDQRRASTFALAEEWVGDLGVGEEEGIQHLVRRYLGAFGPAPKRDIGSWAKLPAATLDPVLQRLSLRRFRDEQGRELLDLPRLPLPDPQMPAPVRFLPTWDATLLVHARRTGILPERFRPRVFDTRTPHSVATFLVDGEVAGTWRYEGGGVELAPFEKLDRAVLRDACDEGERLAALHE
jgi:hypothetical protein